MALKKVTETMEEIAARHGATFTKFTIGTNHAGDYLFTRGPVQIRFNVRSVACRVSIGEWDAPSTGYGHPLPEPGAPHRGVRLNNSTREAFADAALTYYTLDRVTTMIGDYLERERVIAAGEKARTEARQAEWRKFCATEGKDWK